jgi:hypothetical protein
MIIEPGAIERTLILSRVYEHMIEFAVAKGSRGKGLKEKGVILLLREVAQRMLCGWLAVR